ncbi:iron uptake transporter deferrochelatase/peroxidase subunit [Corynebacterium choanae]|uniref:Deferrochelatase n=1 Tax=Corynebacterium choanae TaxID=1862358 RepID=A0A3G6J3J8_9CORY|nr:iron uptake transporter deferrochelatase/peroxidase subunit [Corynebacterium choanae]AZA12499.1 putative deferrochelatase/peroxidase EfeN precursor [Corynebacterium choanae]
MSVSRRQFLAGAGVSVASATAGAVVASAATKKANHSVGDGSLSAAGVGANDAQVPFDGAHQAGITTAQQDHYQCMAFDVVTDSREKLRSLLEVWTSMARRMTEGKEAVEGGAVDVDGVVVPSDTGDAFDLPPSRLTITIGFGPSLFDDRFGLAAQRPAELVDLPHFSGDQKVEEISGGDIMLQACADDPQVVFHAIRVLKKAGSGVVRTRWTQLGYGRTSSTSTAQETPRNLFGFKDGTNNLKVEDEALVNEHVWVQDGPAWFDGGSYMITRKIRMLIENWDRQILHDQEETFGRYKGSGAPLGREDEFDELPLTETVDGEPVVPLVSHSRLANPQENNGARMLRRGYNYIDGLSSFGEMSAGLMFVAFVASPSRDFIPVQRRLSKGDKLNEYVRYESSSIFACPKGVSGDGDYWGKAMFTAS